MKYIPCIRQVMKNMNKNKILWNAIFGKKLGGFVKCDNGQKRDMQGHNTLCVHVYMTTHLFTKCVQITH